MGVPEWDDLVEAHAWYQGAEEIEKEKRKRQLDIDKLADR